MMNDRRSIPESAVILAWLAAALRSSPYGSQKLAVLRRQDNPSSTHWVVGERSSNAEALIFVKMHSERRLYSQEKKALAGLAEYSVPNESYAVPKMLASSEELNCIALQWIDGESIGSTIRESVGRFSPAASAQLGVEIAGRVGTWLQQLKLRTTEPASALPREELRGRFGELMCIIEASRPRLCSMQLKKLLIERFERYLAAAKVEDNCLVHNDFWFDHIWTRGKQIIALDFGRARVGPSGRDALQFYCRLRDMAIFNPLVSKTATDTIVQSFIAGYGGLDPSKDMNRVWEFLTRAEQLAGLTEHSEHSTRGKFRHEAHVRVLTHQLRELVN